MKGVSWKEKKGSNINHKTRSDCRKNCRLFYFYTYIQFNPTEGSSGGITIRLWVG
jgi:hypothetical protein